MNVFKNLNQWAELPEHMAKPNESLLEAAAGVNDHNYEDVQIPATDIYTQEFFFYAYSKILQDRKGVYESKEGFTYIKQQIEQR